MLLADSPRDEYGRDRFCVLGIKPDFTADRWIASALALLLSTDAMSSTQLLDAFDRIDQPRVLVIGDLILDRYTFGDAERVSQEAPVILLRADHREARLGGAANVCQMLRGLDVHVTCAGVIGEDADGTHVHHLLQDAGVETSLLVADDSRPTTVKERFIGRAANRHPHQILRVDSEVRTPISASIAKRLLNQIRKALRKTDVVLVSDYDKGVCAPSLLAELMDLAHKAGVPVVVDPIRNSDYARYRGATALTPNRLETELATGVRIETVDDAFRAGEQLCRELNLEMAFVTLDSDGMALVRPNQPPQRFPTRVREVYDITGAGDMVLAMIGAALAAGVAPEDACRLGNIAGGLEVEQVGVAVIPRDTIRNEIIARQGGPRAALSLEQVALLAENYRAQGKKVVFTNGCFDLLHVGHVSYLEEAAQLGDVLVVAINSDESVRRLKGPPRPFIKQTDRASVLAALGCVDHVLIFDEPTPHKMLEAIQPDVLVKGGTYTPDEVVGHEVVHAYGGQVCVTGAVDGISTTRIVESVTERSTLPPPHYLAQPRRDAPPAEESGTESPS